MLGAMSARIERAEPSESYAMVMADALRVATDASYAAVGEPVEGTILTVARAASDAAQEVVAAGGRSGPATSSPPRRPLPAPRSPARRCS